MGQPRTKKSTTTHVAGKEKAPVFRAVEPVGGAGERERMTVGPGAVKIRPYVVCAVLRGVTFNAKSYKSFMDLQAGVCAPMSAWVLKAFWGV